MYSKKNVQVMPNIITNPTKNIENYFIKKVTNKRNQTTNIIYEQEFEQSNLLAHVIKF